MKLVEKGLGVAVEKVAGVWDRNCCYRMFQDAIDQDVECVKHPAQQ